LAAVLSKKLTDEEVLFVDSLAMEEPKTQAAKAVIKALASGADKATLATKRKKCCYRCVS
jgi:ribosomal protein L4